MNRNRTQFSTGGACKAESERMYYMEREAIGQQGVWMPMLMEHCGKNGARLEIVGGPRRGDLLL